MKTTKILALLFLVLFTPDYYAVAQSQKIKIMVSPQVLSAAGVGKLKESAKNHNRLVVLWSLDCPPCFKELELIGKLSHSLKRPAVTLINVDYDIDVESVFNDVVDKYGLSSIPHYFLSSEENELVKSTIDPQWYGELPRSYFIDKEGKWQGRSGLVTEKIITLWLRESILLNN